MKKLPIILLSSVLAVILVSASANATIIQDNYVGSDDHGYDDVIGEQALFGIS